MNTIIKQLDDGFLTRIEDSHKWENYINQMVGNNTYLPPIERVIFNFKTTETRPVLDPDGKPVTDEKGRVKRQLVDVTPSLATVVYFADGTKCSVVNSDKDTVSSEEKEVEYNTCDASGKEITIKTGRKVKVASEQAKETGFMYAIGKRIFGKVDTDPNSKTFNQVNGNGFGRKLRDICEDAFDMQYDAAWNEEANKYAAKVHKEKQIAAQERRAKRTPSIAENIATLVKQNANLLEKLNKSATL